jgi:hypothetical protein
MHTGQLRALLIEDVFGGALRLGARSSLEAIDDVTVVGDAVFGEPALAEVVEVALGARRIQVGVSNDLGHGEASVSLGREPHELRVPSPLSLELARTPTAPGRDEQDAENEGGDREHEEREQKPTNAVLTDSVREHADAHEDREGDGNVAARLPHAVSLARRQPAVSARTTSTVSTTGSAAIRSTASAASPTTT